jgi:GTPase SAR1 family protein
MVLVGNKSDLVRNQTGLKAQATGKSKEWGVPYFEASARKKDGIDEAFLSLCGEILKRDIVEVAHTEVAHTEEGHTEDTRREDAGLLCGIGWLFRFAR